MKPITIDNLDIKDHVRWAQDQVLLDPVYLSEAQTIAHHPELLGMSAIYESQWAALFEWQKRNVPWATFAPPLKFHLASKRLFSFCLLPTIFWNDAEEEPGEEQESDSDLWRQVMNVAAFAHQPTPLFEKDKSAILNLLGSIKDINGLIAHISARKLQYQKG
jgi:hypothetical protein